ncbi:hypothetical protein, partial [Limnohabitans sp.]|uniref:hypothetical protein n=1 Tax=Limnohabitans sp. TaxID=1907725 RepID=UPI002FDE95BD
ISFNNTLTGDKTLTVNTAGTTLFDKAVSIAQLTTDAPGAVQINAPTVATTGTQTYNDPMTLLANTVLSSTGIAAAGNISFNNTLTGDKTLTVNTAGTTLFDKAVSIAQLTTDAPGALHINAPTVATTGTQTYNDPITLGASATLVANQINMGRVSATIPAVALTLMSQGAQALTDISITGDLNVTTGMGGVNGGLSQVVGTTMNIAGASTFTAHTKTSQVAQLSSARNSFAGPLSFVTARGGSWSNATVVSSSALKMGATNVTGDLSLTSTGGDITQVGPIVVGGVTEIVASAGAVQLTDPANSFVGSVSVDTSGAFSLKTLGPLTLGTVKTEGDTELIAVGKVDLGTGNYGGKLKVDSGDGEIVQSGRINFDGDVNFNAGTAKIDLFNPFNLWKGSIVYKGGIIMINHPQLLNATNAGTLIVRVETTMAAPAQAAKTSPAAGSPAASAAEPAATPKGADISISVNRAPSSAQSGLVTVTVSAEIAATGKGFTFALTDHLPVEAAKSTQVSVSQIDGKPLPEWLRYEPLTQKVVAVSPPPGAFPIQIKANLGGIETVIVITEQPK